MSNVERNKYSIGTVENAICVLELVTQRQSDISAVEIHTRTGIPKPTLHKLLQTLKGLGYIEQNPETNQYYATLRPLQLGYYCLNRQQFLSSYYPYALMYLRRYMCPTSLTAYSGLDPVTIYSAIGGNNIVVDENCVIGKTVSLYASATGRLLLASKSNIEVRNILSNIPLTPYTSKTPYEIDTIIDSLPEVREKGFCRLDGQMYLGFSVFAFPLLDQSSTLIGSLELVFQESEADQIMTQEAVEEIIRTLDKVRIPCI